MELLREVIRNIVVIIILGALLDMVMPSGSMNRYLRLVVGLFIIAAMVNPILQITRNPDLGSVINPGSNQAEGEGIQAIISHGQDISKKNNEQGLKEYKKRLEQQITALAELDPEVKILKASVLIYEDSKSKNFGQIKEVNLLCSRGVKGQDSNNSIVSPVEINMQEKKPGREKQNLALSEPMKNKIIQTLTNFYGLTPEQIYIENP